MASWVMTSETWSGASSTALPSDIALSIADVWFEAWFTLPPFEKTKIQNPKHEIRNKLTVK
jgi:hypothetical protein